MLLSKKAHETKGPVSIIYICIVRNFQEQQYVGPDTYSCQPAPVLVQQTRRGTHAHPYNSSRSVHACGQSITSAGLPSLIMPTCLPPLFPSSLLPIDFPVIDSSIPHPSVRGYCLLLTPGSLSY